MKYKIKVTPDLRRGYEGERIQIYEKLLRLLIYISNVTKL